MYTLKENLEKLEEISKLEKNWNSYDADPIPKNIIEETRILLEGLEKELPQPFISSFYGCGGIQLEWKEENDTLNYLEVEIKEEDIEYENEYRVLMYQDNNKSDCEYSGFAFQLSGAVKKDIISINKLVKLFYKNIYLDKVK